MISTGGPASSAGTLPTSSTALAIDAGWEAAMRRADERAAGSPELSWLPAVVPGTAAAVLDAAGRAVRADDGLDLDETDWWFRTTFQADPAGPDEEVMLRIGGIATLAEVSLNGEPIASSTSMFESIAVDVGARLRGSNELLVACRALGPELRRQRTPRARWRSRLVKDGALRWHRTSVLGRAPGFSPGPAPVGPWRPILLERRHAVAIEDVRVRTSVASDGTGLLTLTARIRGLGGQAVDAAVVRVDGPSGPFEANLDLARDGRAATGRLVIPDVARWWPHTHGEPALHAVSIVVERAGRRMVHDVGSVGFRSIEPGPPGHDVAVDGLDLHVNGRRLFVRGAVWTPADPLTLAADEATLRAALEQARAAGLNLLRVPGIGVYESDLFHDLCDELGILVWQDLAFANLDYPFADPAFHDQCVAEVDAVIDRIGWRPSVAVVCGNSEVEQQVAMLGLPDELLRIPFFVDEVPARLAAAGCDAVYVPSTPTGGSRPFQTSAGIANYFGVGGYRRPLSDVRLADVRFAAECLAFSNVPDDGALGDLASAVGGPEWKAGIPRDNGSSWDFEDIRDHYLGELYGVDPIELRATDPARYLELGRLVTGEVMAEVFGEWRRAGSPCGGGLVLWLRDQRPGAGWGVIDHRGAPKAAWHHLRRALAPIAVWMTDEGLNGIRIHVANDGPAPLAARLRIAAYQDDEILVDEAVENVRLDGGATIERDAEAMLGRFVDIGWAYRFGPGIRSVVVATLEGAADISARTPADRLDAILEAAVPAAPQEVLSQAFRFPLGRSAGAFPASRLGLAGRIRLDADGRGVATIASTRYVHGVRLSVPGFVPADDAFGLEPHHPRRIRLEPAAPGGDHGRKRAEAFGGPVVTAANLVGRVSLAVEDGR